MNKIKLVIWCLHWVIDSLGVKKLNPTGAFKHIRKSISTPLKMWIRKYDNHHATVRCVDMLLDANGGMKVYRIIRATCCLLYQYARWSIPHHVGQTEYKSKTKAEQTQTEYNNTNSREPKTSARSPMVYINISINICNALSDCEGCCHRLLLLKEMS